MEFGRERGGEGSPIKISTDKTTPENHAAGAVMAILYLVHCIKGKEAQKAIEYAANLAKELDILKATQATQAIAAKVTSSSSMLPALPTAFGVAAVFGLMWLKRRSEAKEGIPPGLVLTEEEIKAARKSNLDGKVHVAVVGHSGVGKSTMVNRLHGLRPEDGQRRWRSSGG